MASSSGLQGPIVADDEEPKVAGWRRIRRPSWLMIGYGVGLLVVLGVLGMLAMSGLRGGGAKSDKGGAGMHGRKSGGGGAKKRPRGGKKGRRGSLPAPSGPEYAALLEANPAGGLDDVLLQVTAGAGQAEAFGHEPEFGGPQPECDYEQDVRAGVGDGLPALRAPPA